MKIFYKILFSFIAILSSLITNAQTGPGGVGNATGANSQPELLFWLSADSLGLANGASVSAWPDISGNSRNFSQGTAGNQAVFNSTGVGGVPSVTFDGTDDYLVDEDAEDYINGISGLSFFAIIKSAAIGTDAGFFDTEDPDGGDDVFAIRYDNGGGSGGGDDVIKIGIRTSGGSSAMESSEFIQTTSSQMLTYAWGSGSAPDLYENGSFDTPTFAASSLTGNFIGSTKAIVGKGPKDASDAWNGEVAEIIFFGEELNSAQRSIVENYLGHKYSITIGNDKYAGNDASYIHNLSGIGKEADGEQASGHSAGVYLESNGSFDATDYVVFAHNNTTNDIASINTTGTVTSCGAEAAWNREWYFDKTGAQDVTISFDIKNGINDGQYPDGFANYVLLYRATTGVNYSQVMTATGIQNGQEVYFNVSNANLNDGYYTIGTLDEANSPVEGKSGRTWYTLITGDWESWETWTLDPSGALPNNPSMEVPSDNPIDNVVILSGRTITVNSNNVENTVLLVDGELDLQTTTGHSFSEIRGSGRIRMAADNFPSGNASHFTSEGLGEGTAIYYGSGYTLSTARTFYNLEIELDAKTDELIMMADYQINGDFSILKGEWQINDNSSATRLNLIVENTLTVSDTASISVGTADAYSSAAQSGYGNYHKGNHLITIGGDFYNYGIVRLTNQIVPDYDSRATNGAASLIFAGAQNNKFYCDSTTDIYYLVVDKGVDRTYELELFSTDSKNFALFGDNDENWDFSVQAHPENRKALWIAHGTLRLTGNLIIPTLTEGSRDYTIGQYATLALDGVDVFVGNTANENTNWASLDLSHGIPDGIDNFGGNQGLYPFGKLQVDNGHYYQGESEAINFRDEAPGIIEVNGGLLEINQIAISSGATNGYFSFILNGGEVRLTGQYGVDNGRAILNLDKEDMTFTMTGGTLTIQDVSGHDPNGIHILSSAENYNVSGGTLSIDAGANFEIFSTVPFYDVEILSGTTVTLQNEFAALQDLTINSGATLSAAGFDVSIGDDFTFMDGASFNHGGNTVIFNENYNSLIDVRNTVDPTPLVFNNVTLSKDQRWNTSLFHKVEVNGRTRVETDPPILIEGNLTIVRGEFDTDEWRVDLEGNIEITDGQILNSNTPEGWIMLNGSAQQTIKGSNTVAQAFGNFEIDNIFGVELLSNIDANDFTITNGVVDLGIYNLDISGSVSVTSPGTSQMFQTAGNASDGGLSIPINGNGVYTFNIGTNANATARYTPADVTVSNYADDGKITVSVADEVLATTAPGGGDILSYYWHVENTDFSTLPDVAYSFKYDQSDVDGSLNEVNFWPGSVMYIPNFARAFGTTSNLDDAANTIAFNAEEIKSANYTAGELSRFLGAIEVFYTTNSGIGNWDSQSKWTKTSDGVDDGNTGYPQAGDVAIIKSYGNPNGNCWVYGNVDISVASVIFDPDLGGWNPRIWVTKRNANLDLGTVSGAGEIYLEVIQTQTPTFSGDTDLGEFSNEANSVFNFKIDADNQLVDMPVNIEVYPNIRIEAGDGANDDNNRILQTSIPITVNGTVRLDRSPRWRINHDTKIGGDLRITWQANRTTVEIGDDREVNIEIDGDLIFENGNGSDGARFLVKNDNQNSYEHTVTVLGNIEMESNLDGTSSWDFYNGAAPNNNAILILAGENNGEFTNASPTIVPDLYRIILNKGGTGTPTFDFSDNFSLNGPTDGDEKAIELISGRLMLSDAAIDVTLSSGGADFKIPAGAELATGTSATVRVTGNNTGIYLDGEITAGWNTKWYINGGTNNYIEYSSSGSAKIDIFQAEFYVGSQIRRSAITDDGILSFNQNHSNSTVVIGTDAYNGGETTRGVFELVNPGCEFVQTDNAVLTIANAVTNASAPTFYLDIDELDVTLGTGSKITFGSADTDAGQDMTIYSSVALKDIDIDNSSTNNPEVSTTIVPLEADNLTIASGATFDGNALNLTLTGDLTNNGTFNANGNTTYFSGLSNQQITGTGITDFYKLNYTSGLDLSITNDVTVENNLTMTSGTFTDNDNTLTVQGNITFGGTHNWGGTSNGIYLNGSSEQIMTGAGTYDRLTINNSSGVSINPNAGSDITIVDELQLNEGIFDIDQYLLYLQSTAEITTTATFDANTLIQTNISFTDAGILKDFPAIASTTVYEIPVGVGGKYTPIELSIDAVDAGGSIRFKAANEMQPTITNDADETCLFNDLENVLQYHWILESTGITNFTADMTMEFDPSDALAINTCGYDTSHYIAARILTYGDNTWNKYDYSNFNGEAHQLEFSFTGTDDDGISGDYTAGIEQPAPNVNGAIPNKVTEFITLGNGNWDDQNNWARYDSNMDTLGPVGDGVPASGPRGAVIYVDDNHTLTIPDNYISAYKTIIQPGATLDIGTTFGHRLGIVSGTGTLYLERGDLPAGIYDEFFSSAGGTLEFGGYTLYEVLGGVTEVNNLTFSGGSVRRFPNNNVIVNGDITVDGPLVIHYRTKTISLNGDLIKTAGRIRFAYFDSWNSVIEFIGNGDQNIQGAISDDANESLGDVIVNKPSGNLILDDEVLIKGGVLNLTTGLIDYTGSGMLKLTNTSTITGGSTSSYINGPLYKDLNSSTDFTYPIGKDGVYRPIGLINPTDDALWMAEYTPANAVTALGAGLATVSGKDNWVLSDVNNIHPQAKIKLYWGTETNVSPDAADHADLRVVFKDGTGTWQTLGNDGYSGDVNSGWLVSTNQASFSTVEFTIASSTNNNPLPVTLIDFTARVENENQVALSWKTAVELNNDYFVVERSRDGIIFEEVVRVNGNGTTSEMSTYNTTDYDPHAGISYYRLRQVDYDGQEEIFPMVVVEIRGFALGIPHLNIHPNPYTTGDIVVDIGGFVKTQDAQVVLADVSGNAVWSGRVAPTREDITEVLQPEFEKLKPGFYIIVIVSNDRKISTRIIKK